jgi:hypothetical protein
VADDQPVTLTERTLAMRIKLYLAFIELVVIGCAAVRAGSDVLDAARRALAGRALTARAAS